MNAAVVRKENVASTQIYNYKSVVHGNLALEAMRKMQRNAKVSFIITLNITKYRIPISTTTYY